MSDSTLRRLSGEFRDRELERAFRDEAWPDLRVQTAATVLGLSAALIVSSRSDFVFLRDTSWFIPTVSARLGAGGLGAILGLWLLALRPDLVPMTRIVVKGWIGLAGMALCVVCFAYPATEASEASRSEVLVFTSFWISLTAIMSGFGFFAFPRAVGALTAMLLAAYVGVCIIHWETALYPKISQMVLVATACVFGSVMCIVTNRRARDRYRLTKLYETAQRAAEKSEEFQTFLLAATGHDIRQPVYALDLNASAMESAAERGDLDQVRALARRQRAVARNVTGMLSSILQLSYLDTGRVDLSPIPLSAGRVLSDAAEPLRELSAERGLTMRLIPSTALLQADPAVLGSIVSNLVVNAASHSRGTRVVCGARRRADAIELWIVDDGKGLCPDPIKLRSIDDLRASEGAGRVRAGLGLEIIFRLAERGGLAIELRSHPLKGVTARIACPLSECKRFTSDAVFIKN